jgi:hypothetical protein
MEASDISEVMERLFGESAFIGSRVFVYCMTRSEMVLLTDEKAGRAAGKSGGQVVFVPMVCGRCERVFGGLGECAGKAEIDERILRGLPVFKQVEEWCDGKVEVVRPIQRAEGIMRLGADYAVCMQTVVIAAGRRLEVANYLAS